MTDLKDGKEIFIMFLCDIFLEAKCECPSGRVFWEEDGRCYDPYTTGIT